MAEAPQASEGCWPGDDSDTELDCLPDCVGKLAHQGKPLGAWIPVAKKEFQPSTAQGVNKYVTSGGGHSSPVVASQHLLLKLLSEPSVLLGGCAVRAGGAILSNETSRRAVREKLLFAEALKEKGEFFSALRWVISALGLCRSMKKSGNSPQAKDSNPAIDTDLVERVVKSYKDLRTRVLAQLNTGKALASKNDLEEKAQQHHSRGNSARLQNNLDQALLEFKEVLRIRILLVGEQHPDTALARSHVATVIRDNGNPRGAMIELRKALRIQEAALGEGHPHVAISRNNIGVVLKQQGKAHEALLEHRRALVILIRHYNNSNNKYVADVHEHLGNALRIQHDIFGAVVEHEAALQIRKTLLSDANHPKIARLSQKLVTLQENWSGPGKSMMEEMRQRTIKPEDLQWKCPGCKWETKLDVCSCCAYRRPLPKAGVPQFFAGMTFAFTGILPKSVHPSAWKEWQFAEQRGAVPTEDVDEGVTHLVYREGYERSGKVQQAQQLNIKVVLADWFYQSITIGLNLDEGPFLAEVGSGRRITTKRLPHARPGGGTERAHSCTPFRCVLAPPKNQSCLREQKLPGPTMLVDPHKPAATALPVGEHAPLSPTARRPHATSPPSFSEGFPRYILLFFFLVYGLGPPYGRGFNQSQI